jgi:YVTN family beta-propeller protein
VAFLAGSSCATSRDPRGAAVTPREANRQSVTTTTEIPVPSVTVPPPAVVDAANVYSDAAAGKLSPSVASDPLRVYVPNSESDTVTVIDPIAKKVIATFPVGRRPQHVVPSYDLTTLWVADNDSNALTPIDPKTSRPGHDVKVDDPYNLYFTPDGASAIVVAEHRRRLDFRDPNTMALQYSIPVDCPGVNHADFTADGRYMVASCEFGGALIEIDLSTRAVTGRIRLGAASGPAGRTMKGTSGPSMPQDVRLKPDGSQFYVADMASGGVHVIDAAAFREVAFVRTGIGAHGVYPSRDGTSVFVVNRGTDTAAGARRPPGSISVLDVSTNAVTATWPIPGGGSPDMGNLTPDGTELWVSGRYDDEVYALNTTTGELLARIHVGRGPHGLTVWPQPGHYSLGHTGNMR